MKNTNSVSKTYALPISGSYWKDAVSEMKNVRALIMCALLCAVSIVLEMFQIPIIPGVLQISFSCISVSLCSFLTGPVIAIPCGIIVDVVGALINGYSFFFGYTLTAILSAVIYALFLYRSNLSFERIALAKFTINLFVNVLIGSVWRLMMYGLPYAYYITIAGIKNLVLLPFEVFLIVFFISALLPSLKRMKLCNQNAELKLSKKKMIAFIAILVVASIIVAFGIVYRSQIEKSIDNLKNSYKNSIVTENEIGDITDEITSDYTNSGIEENFDESSDNIPDITAQESSEDTNTENNANISA